MKLEFDLNALAYIEEAEGLSLQDIVAGLKTENGESIHLPTLKKIAYGCYLSGCDSEGIEPTLTEGQVFSKVGKDLEGFMATVNKGVESLPGNDAKKKTVTERLKK